MPACSLGPPVERPAGKAAYYLDLLHIEQSARSRDYVLNKKQYQLSSLVTEQSHPLTRDFSWTAAADPGRAVEQLLEVDHDISRSVQALKSDPDRVANIEQAVAAVTEALRAGHRVYIYGTGSTGRLAHQVTAIWNGFWSDLRQRPDWPRLRSMLEARHPRLDADGLPQAVVGDITGGDRALVQSLEGFEDLQLIGRLQLEDAGIDARHDVVFAVTEGGETSAVIGAIRAAGAQPGSRAENLYFVYNNPDALLRPFERSNAVLNDAHITKINFTTGPQAIMGSTRMQATTSQTLLVASILQQAVRNLCGEALSSDALRDLGLAQLSPSIVDNLQTFVALQRDVEAHRAGIQALAQFEYQAYVRGRRAAYFGAGLINTVFIDITERAPTFSLMPLDQVGAPARSWIDVHTDAAARDDAWRNILLRDFRGLDPERYGAQFQQIGDPLLRQQAMDSLRHAGSDQRLLYDFSTADLLRHRYAEQDIAIAYLRVDEVGRQAVPGTPFADWVGTMAKSRVPTTVVLIGPARQAGAFAAAGTALRALNPRIARVEVRLGISADSDPLRIQQTLAAKMILNTQSTEIMGQLGRVQGNAMVFVRASNLKLLGRATFLTQQLTNQILARSPRFKDVPPLDYNQANAIVDAAMTDLDAAPAQQQTAAIPLALVAIFEALQHRPHDWHAAKTILARQPLNHYLATLTAPP